ncbi:MAG TPA: hypothetical protein VEB42_04605, partial [Chitinophagaceae bacterium]|nr:hypothetical protein [Chitinophagaceae bacterium]
MKKPFYLLLPVLLSACSGNLVKNPGAESVPLTNEWTIASGRWMQRGKAPLPQEGKAYFFPAVAAQAELFQDVDVSSYGFFTDLGVMSVRYEAYMRAFPQRPADVSYEIIEFRDGDHVLDSFVTQRYDTTNAWIKVSHSQTLPKGSRSVRVRLLSDRYNGSNNDGYHDDVRLSVS